MTVVPGRDAARRPSGRRRQCGSISRPAFGPGRLCDAERLRRHLPSEPIGNRVGFWTIAHTSSARDPLGTSISAAPLPAALGRQRVNISGYPGDRCFVTAASAGRRLCHQWRARDRAVVEQGGMLHYLNDTFGGHSGSQSGVITPSRISATMDRPTIVASQSSERAKERTGSVD